MFPPLSDRLARAGFTAVSFNFSGSGVDDAGDFAFPERFGHNTFSAELSDATAVLDSLFQGELGVPPPTSVGLVGHSRGGGIAVLQTARDPRIQRPGDLGRDLQRPTLAGRRSCAVAPGRKDRGDQYPNRPGASSLPRRPGRHRPAWGCPRHPGRGTADSRPLALDPWGRGRIRSLCARRSCSDPLAPLSEPVCCPWMAPDTRSVRRIPGGPARRNWTTSSTPPWIG